MAVNKSVTDKAKDKVLSFKNVLFDNKKYSIIIAVILVVTLIGGIITNVVVNKLADKAQYYVDYAAAYGRAITDLRTSHKSDSYGSYYKQDESVREYEGVMYDGEKWDRDDAYFVEFIKPAFNYANGEEYYQHRTEYAKIFGDGDELKGYKNRFLSLVMTSLSTYDVKDADGNVVEQIHYAGGLAKGFDSATDEGARETVARNACANTKSATNSSDWFKSYPVSILTDNGYSYIAIIKATVYSSEGVSQTATFVASYTMKDVVDSETGVVNTQMSNFECWPAY